MGTIIARKRKDGTTGYTAMIRIKRAGVIIHKETETFDRDQTAKAWIKKRETELAQPGALDKPTDPLLADVIDKYNQDKQRPHGKTKDQVLRTIKNSRLGEMRCSEIRSPDIIAYIQSIKAQPQTVGNYLSHLAAVFTVARPAWGYPLDKLAMEDARVVAVQMGIISRSKERNRRPTLDELDKLMRYYTVMELKRKDAIPMTRLIPFAIFSTRRQEEITRMVGADLDKANLEIIVRDMKNPGEKIGNDVRTALTPEALQLIELQPATQGRIWPYNAESVSTSFSRACLFLGIEDLHFHDLRHDGISRLFELGWNIPRVAGVSGHRSWKSLQRYTHLRQVGDKYLDWPWMVTIDAVATSKPA
ncbi:MAG: tyrosine-type recombinase/integrase [Rhodoferax sp.]